MTKTVLEQMPIRRLFVRGVYFAARLGGASDRFTHAGILPADGDKFLYLWSCLCYDLARCMDCLSMATADLKYLQADGWRLHPHG